MAGIVLSFAKLPFACARALGFQSPLVIHGAEAPSSRSRDLTRGRMILALHEGAPHACLHRCSSLFARDDFFTKLLLPYSPAGFPSPDTLPQQVELNTSGGQCWPFTGGALLCLLPVATAWKGTTQVPPLLRRLARSISIPFLTTRKRNSFPRFRTGAPPFS